MTDLCLLTAKEAAETATLANWNAIVTKPKPALRYHGAKWRIAPWIISHFPPHKIYVEPFGGAAGVLMQKPRSCAEVYNDLDGEIVNFFRVVRDPAQRAALIEALVLTPYARTEFELAYEPSDDPIERARRLCVRAQMGFGSAGASKGQTGFRIDTRREYATAQRIWSEYPDSIVQIGVRFSAVLIENRPAIDVLQQHDGESTLHYVDPPYMHETRVLQGGMTTGRGGYYRHEMTDEDHEGLLSTLLALRGMVVVSGYDSDMYHGMLRGWKVMRRNARIAAGRGCGVRTEVIWINPACLAEIESDSGALFRNSQLGITR